MLQKFAILLETRKSNKRQNFDYSQMKFDQKIIEAESIVNFEYLIFKAKSRRKSRRKSSFYTESLAANSNLNLSHRFKRD